MPANFLYIAHYTMHYWGWFLVSSRILLPGFFLDGEVGQGFIQEEGGKSGTICSDLVTYRNSYSYNTQDQLCTTTGIVCCKEFFRTPVKFCSWGAGSYF